MVQLADAPVLIAIPGGRSLALEQRDAAPSGQDQVLGLDLRLLFEHRFITGIAEPYFDRVAGQKGRLVVSRQDRVEPDLEDQPRFVINPARSGPHGRSEAAFPRQVENKVTRGGSMNQFETAVEIGLAHAIAADQHRQAFQGETNGADRAIAGNVEVGEGHGGMLSRRRQVRL